MKKLTQGATRLLVLALGLGWACCAWAEYVAGWDLSALGGAVTWSNFATSMASDGTDMLGGEEQTLANDKSFRWTAPSGDKSFTLHAVVSNIPSGEVPLISWILSNENEIIIGKSATSDGVATIKNAWANDSNTATSKTYSGAGETYQWAADSGEHTLTVVYEAVTAKTTRFYIDGVLVTQVTGLLWNDVAHRNIVFGGTSTTGGLTPYSNVANGMVIKSAYYRQGVHFAPISSNTLASNDFTLNINSNFVNADGSVTIDGKGLSVDFSAANKAPNNTKRITAVVEVANVPVSGTILDYNLGNACHVGLSITAASGTARTLNQSWLVNNSGTAWGDTTSFNYASHATAGNSTFSSIAFAWRYVSGSDKGAQTFFDGASGIAESTGLYTSQYLLTGMYVGALRGSNALARGMRIRSIKLYTTEMDAYGAAATASDVILTDGCTAAFSSGATYKYCGSDFTNGFTIDLAGQTVALGTYPGTSGLITVNDSVSGGSATMTLPEGFTGSFAGTGKLSVTAHGSILPSSGGMDLSSATITIPDASGTVIAGDSVTIGNSGIQVALASMINDNTVMVKASNIPSTSCRLIGWMTGKYNSKNIENCAYYDDSSFNQCYYLDGTWQNNYSTSGDSRSWTRDALDHWIEISYARAGGTYTYLDGSQKVSSTDLKWGSNSTSKITIGGTATSSTSPATGMVIKEVAILSSGLSDSQMSKVTAALNNGWTVNAAGTTLTSSESFHALPGYENVSAVGTMSVDSDGTLGISGLTAVQVGDGATFDVSAVSGLTQVIVLSGGELTIGKQRPGSVVVTTGGILNVSSIPTASECITGYIPTAELSVEDSTYFTGTVKLDGETVTPVVDGGTATLTGTAVAGDPTYTGNGWWWDFEFNGNGNNIGSNGTGLQWDASRPTVSGGSAEELGDYTAAIAGNQMVHLLARPWRHVGGENVASDYPTEFTAVMFCKAGTTANGVLVAFGSSTRGTSTKTIALATGDHPENGEMRLVLINGKSSAAVDLVQGGFTLDNITSANHLYAFTVQNVGNVSHVAVYADGDLLTTYVSDGIIALGNGFQIGSIHGSITSAMQLNYLADGSSGDPDEATMDFLRVSNVALSDAAIKALAAEYRYVSPNGIAERTLSANATWTDETNTSWSQKTLNEDGSTTTTAQAAPNNGTVVEITASTDVQLTMDLASNVSYEKVTFQGDGAITVKAGGTAPTVTTRTYINTDVTMDIAAFASLGATTIADGKTLTVVPDETSTLNAGIALGIRGETSTIVTGTVTLGEGSQVVLPSSMVSVFASYGFTLTLTPDASGRYVYTIARDDNPVYVTKAANRTITYAMYPDAVAGTPAAMALTLPAEPATIPNDFAYTVTFVNNHASESLAVATAISGGSIAVSSGTVELSGDSSVANVSGSGTVQVTGSLAVSGTFANTLTLAGDGTVIFATLPASALTFGTWTGTVVLPQLASIAGDSFSFNSYGVEGSTVRVSGIGGGWLKSEEVNPTIDIPEGVTLTISDFSASFNNTFKALSGAGTFAVTYNTAIDTTSGSWYSNYSAYFLVKNVSNFTGSLTTATPGIVIGSAKPEYRTAGGKIMLTTSATIATGKTWTATEGIVLADAAVTLTNTDGALSPTPTTTVENSYVKSVTDAGATIYSVQAYVTVSIPSDVEHATATVNGDAVASGSSVQVDVGTDVTIDWTATSGYKITAGATQTITSIAGNVTATPPTVEAKGATVSGVTFDYGADFATATVTATVSGDATVYTLTVDDKVYEGAVSGSTVTFSDVVTGRADAYDSFDYTISATDGTSSVVVSGGSGSATVADSTKWIDERADTTGTAAAGGSWTTAVTYNDNVARVTDNRFTASNCSTGDLVTVAIKNVVYAELSDTGDKTLISADSQGAFALGTNVVGDVVTTNFMILAMENDAFVWKPAECPAVTAGTNIEYNIVFTFDYAHGKYSVSVNDYPLSVNSETTFDLCSPKSEVSSIDFKGSGTFGSLTGVESTGYMVRDSAGHWYASVADAIAAYDKNNGPYYILHDANPPSGWKIVTENGVKVLKKVVTGVFFMTY